eukprot:CAMPEP_0194513926 /NCGR_PEP_ID=MMETSP0253-20130528/46228_1 /TAXON_ID=2966 /ORGANISM="Noctiluca scintillans" /LENGTH=45 /DNA_ID= /DNA_START= /DNA_END= /DNA_ORIENTATION=
MWTTFQPQASAKDGVVVRETVRLATLNLHDSACLVCVPLPHYHER